MPKIPGAEGLNIPQDRGGTLSYRGAEAPNVYGGSSIRGADLSSYGKGMQQAGEAIGNFGAEVQERNDRFGLAAAKSQFLQESITAQNELADDPDFETAKDRYVERMNKAKSRLAPKGVSGEAMQMWGLEADDVVMRGSQSVFEGARVKRISSENAYVDGELFRLQKSLESARTPEEAAEAINTGASLIRGLSERGSLSADASGEKQRQFRSAASVLALQKLPEFDRLDALRNGGVPVSVINNNPGNIRGADGKFKKFPTADAGLEAMKNDLSVKVSGNSRAMKANFGENYDPTIANIISTWAPSSENDTEAYIKHVSEKSGILPDEPLKNEDIDRIMPAMIEMEGGKVSSDYYGAAGEIVANLEPGTAKKMYEIEKGAIISKAIDSDPAKALVDLEGGVYDEYYDTEEKIKYRDEASAVLLKQKDKAEALQMAREIQGHIPEYNKYLAGDFTLEDVSRMERMGDSPVLAQAMRDKLTKEIKDPPAIDQANAFVGLNDELNDIRMHYGAKYKKGKISGGEVKLGAEGLKKIREWQNKVIDRASKKLITPKEAETFLNNFSAPIMNAIDSGLTENTPGLRIMPGRADPYVVALNTVDGMLSENKMPNDAATKKELFMRFDQFLGKFVDGKYVVTGKYESSGNSADDDRVINAAMRLAIDSINQDNFPEVGMMDEKPNYIISAPAPQQEEFTTMEDAAGNRARVYKDGRIEEIK